MSIKEPNIKYFIKQYHNMYNSLVTEFLDKLNLKFEKANIMPIYDAWFNDYFYITGIENKALIGFYTKYKLTKFSYDELPLWTILDLVEFIIDTKEYKEYKEK